MISLLTGTGFVLTLLVGLGLASRFAAHSVAPKKLLGFVIGFGLLCRLAFALLTPIGYAPDEEAHVHYVEWVATHRTIPVETNNNEEDEFWQPPAYYVSLAPAFSLARGIGLNRYRTYIFLRMLTLCFWAGTVYCIGRLRRHRQDTDVLTATLTYCFLCLLPTYVYMSSVINNDNMAIFIGGVVFWLVLGPEMTWKRCLCLGLLLGIGLLTKLSTIVYFCVVLTKIVISLYNKSAIRSGTMQLLTSMIIGFLMWLPLGLRNLRVYDSMTGEVANEKAHWTSTAFAIRVTLQQVFKQFWATFHFYNNPAGLYPYIGILFTFVAAYGLIRSVLSRSDKPRTLLTRHQDIALIAGPAIGLQLLMALKTGLLYGMGQGRYFFPLLLPISVLFAIGLSWYKTFRSAQSSLYVVVFFAAYTFWFEVYSLWILNHS